MEKGNIYTIIVINMKVNGKMIKNKVMGFIIIIIEVIVIKVILKKITDVEKVFINGKMAQFMKVSFIIT